MTSIGSVIPNFPPESNINSASVEPMATRTKGIFWTKVSGTTESEMSVAAVEIDGIVKTIHTAIWLFF